jgi:hypothetical protein
MVLDGFKEKRRKKQLDKVSKELERLEKENIVSKKTASVRRRDPFESSTNTVDEGKKILKWAVLILFLLWVATFWIYSSKLSSINEDNQDLTELLDLKTLELTNLSADLADLSVRVEQKEKSVGELNTQYTDLEELSNLLQDKVDELTLESNELEINNTNLLADFAEQEDLVDAYKLCIQDDDGPIDQALSVCDSYT